MSSGTVKLYTLLGDYPQLFAAFAPEAALPAWRRRSRRRGIDWQGACSKKMAERVQTRSQAGADDKSEGGTSMRQWKTQVVTISLVGAAALIGLLGTTSGVPFPG